MTELFRPSPMESFACIHFQDYLSDEIPAFHRASYAAMETYRNYIELSPRGFAKSVRATLVRPVFAICTLVARDYLVASHGLDEAKERVRRIRRSFEEKAELSAMYGIRLAPEFKGKWSDEHIELKVRGVLCSVRAKGMNAQIRGGHYDELCIDDPEETKGAKSPTIRKQVWDVLERSILPTLNPKTHTGDPPKIIIIGTPIHIESLVWRVFNNEDNRFDDFRRMKFSAEETGETMDLTGAEIGDSIWPSRFPKSMLLEFRRKYGERAYQSEYMCEPMAEGDQMWFSEFFKERYTHVPPEDHLVTVTSVDPAKTMTDFKEGSQTGIVTLSKERFEDNPRILVRAACGAYMTPTERAKEAIRQAIEFKSKWILVEDTTKSSPGHSIGGSDVAQLIREEAAMLGHWHQFAVLTTYSRGVDKAHRGLVCVPFGEQGRIIFPKNTQGHMWSLYQQLMVFPSGEKRDLADAFHNGVIHLMKSKQLSDQDWPDSRPTLSRRALIQARAHPSRLVPRWLQ